MPQASGRVGYSQPRRRSLATNVGGGVKWYAPNNRWGLRGDYRFVANKSKDDAPIFFGRDTRYAHRVYGAVIINTVK